MALYMCQVLHIVAFLGSRRMETAPTSIEVLLRPAQSQSDEPSDLRGSLSPTIVYTAPGSHQAVNIFNGVFYYCSGRCDTPKFQGYIQSVAEWARSLNLLDHSLVIHHMCSLQNVP